MRIATLAIVLLLASWSITSAQAPAAQEPLATVNGIAITNDDVEAALGQNLAQLQDQIYQLKKAQLEALIEERLIAAEAARRGVSSAALVSIEVTSQISTVTEDDIVAFFEANRERLQRDVDAWRDQIRTHLTTLRATERRQAFVKGLREDANIEVFLAAPAIHRADIALDDAPYKGSPDAPVTLVEYGDFHCPFCRRVQPVLQELMHRYGDKLRIVYKDFPIDSLHPQARAAAEAARCAGEQGKFWEFHDLIYAGPSDGSAATMGRYAAEVGLDPERFEQCRSSRRYQAQVQRDLEEGARLGVSGTPGFFINGRFLSGAQPVEAFARMIDEELERLR